YIVALDENRAYMLTAAAYYVWSLCDGSKTLEELIKYMSKELSENTETPMKEEELIEPVTLIINQLSEVGLLKFT
ncbi:MAG: PqqD family protein, partial [Desulfurococcales archaeon]|nr:PqqD family protein [Desulfurococcales archaeon]